MLGGRIVMDFRPSQGVEALRKHSLRPSARPGADVISLASGEPDFATPKHITRALAVAVEAGATHYAPWHGDPELRRTLASGLAARTGASWESDQILVTHGGSGALASATLTCVNQGDRIVIPTPTYSLFADLVRMAGGEPVFVPPAKDLHLDLAAVDAAARGSRMIILCHPCNPTGVVYRPEELARLAEIATSNDLLVLCDEAYDHIVYDGVDFMSSVDVEGFGERLLYAQTFSKTYAMTGWRVGFLAGPGDVIAAAGTVHRSMTGPLNTAVQRAALAAVTGSQEPMELMRREYHRRRSLVLELLRDVPGVEVTAPEGTFYAFLRYAPQVSSLEMVDRALAHGVAVRPGREFGAEGEGYIRLSFSVDRDSLTEGVRRLCGVIAA